MRMNTSDFPKTYSANFSKLSGGLNLRDLGYLVDMDESPNMKNLMWRDGMLQSRDGQQRVAETDRVDDPSVRHICYSVSQSPFHGYTFFHIGWTIQCLYTGEPIGESQDRTDLRRCAVVATGIAPGRGTFFQYMGRLYYKNSTDFYAITYDREAEQVAHVDPARFYLTIQDFDKQAYSLFVLDEDTSVFERVTDLSAFDTELGTEYVVFFRENASGRLLSYKPLPAEGDTDYAGSIVADGVDAVLARNVWSYAKFKAVFSASDGLISGARLVSLFDPASPQEGPDCRWLGAMSGSPDLVFAPNDRFDTDYDRWTVWPVTGSPGSFYFSNRGMWEDTGITHFVYHLPEALISATPFTLTRVAEEAAKPGNAPVIVINASPITGSGDMYQPENRLSHYKTVWYNAVAGTSVYHLPVKPIKFVEQVTVNDVVVDAANYDVNKTAGTVTFHAGHIPDPGNPAVNNTVKITYYKINSDAKYAVLHCPYATVASGGGAEQYIVLGGCAEQPDAIFWNANDELAVQPWYFPMPCYNLVGSAGDPVTGFGRQYNDTLVFSEHSVGKLSYTTQTVDGRAYPAFSYARVNAKIGCDLPWTIQQVENNVVFCNSYIGACIVLSSSAAYENNIRELSQKIRRNDSDAVSDIAGLLSDIRESDTAVLGFDDDERYWLCANGKVYVWDYSISTYADPSWFYWTGVDTTGLFLDQQHNAYSVREHGGIDAFLHVNNDEGEPIEKVYQFPTLNFGTYELLKDVTDLVLAVRSDVPSTIDIRYDTDYESRDDQTPVIVCPEASLIRAGRRIVQTARRKPKCRHVRQFGLTLSNNTSGEDLALVSAQILYRLVGKER